MFRNTASPCPYWPNLSKGVYDTQARDVTVLSVYTNTCPVDVYRVTVRSKEALLLEKLAGDSAPDLGLSVDEILRRNFIRPEQFTYRTQTGRLYDVGELQEHMDMSMKRAG